MLWAASIDGRLSSLVACHYTDLHLFNLFVYLANKLSLSLSPFQLLHCLFITSANNLRDLTSKK